MKLEMRLKLYELGNEVKYGPGNEVWKDQRTEICAKGVSSTDV